MMMMTSSPAASCSPTTHQQPLLPSSFSCCRPAGVAVRGANNNNHHLHLQWRRWRHYSPASALPDPQAAAGLLAVAATVGVAATLLLRPSSSSAAPEQQQAPEDAGAAEAECPDCGGTGLCGRCKGEGFVFKQLSEETATKARKAAKNMATRYTSGLPTKWTYCNKCSSTRSCTTCRGSGTIKAPATSTY